MRTPEEACELINEIVFKMEFIDVPKTTIRLVIEQHAILIKEAAEGTEENVRTLLLDLEIRNRLLDSIQLLMGSLSMAIAALPEEDKLRSKLIRVQRAVKSL